MRERLKRPLNQSAVLAATTDLYEHHPELTENGVQRPLDVTDVAAAPYQAYWRDRYLHHGGEFEESIPELELEQKTEVGNERQPCPLPTCKIPIVILPGIMGSRLYFPSIRKYWDPDDIIRMMWDWVHVSPEQKRTELHFLSDAKVMTGVYSAEGDHGRGWFGLSYKYYGLLLEVLNFYFYKFNCKSCPVYGVGYDFRQSNGDSGLAVAERIRAILAETKAEKFILITHSMGGLVARSMLKQSSDLQGKALAVLHLMQPAHGAPIFYRYCLEGADGALGYVLGNEAHEFLTVASGQRGAIELLPTNEYHRGDTQRGVDWISWSYDDGSVNTAAWRGDVYSLYLQDDWKYPGLLYLTDLLDLNREKKGLTLLTPEMRDRITEAQRFHEEMLQTFSLRSVTWCIYSANQDTCMGMWMDMKKTEQLRRYRLNYSIENLHGITPDMQKKGDDTVPLSSSDGRHLTEEERRKAVSTSGHGDGCVDLRMINAVIAILEKVLRSS